METDSITDEEKKKYFKVTANHGLETGQKYTQSNVRYEKQVAKKRKIEQRDQKKRQAQTIKRSRLLSIPEYAGVGLHRETGVRSLTVDRAHADEAFVSQLRYEDVYIAHGTVLSAHPIPSSSHTLLTQVGGRNGSYIFSTDGDISHSSRERWPKALDDASLVHYTAFPSLAMSTSIWPAHDPQKLLACTSGGFENVFIGSIVREDRMTRPEIKLSIGNDETTLWDSAISSTGDTAVIGGSDRITHLSMEGHIIAGLRDATHSRSVSWLNASTIAAGSGKSFSFGTPGLVILLLGLLAGQLSPVFGLCLPATAINYCSRRIRTSHFRTLVCWVPSQYSISAFSTKVHSSSSMSTIVTLWLLVIRKAGEMKSAS